jgi:hypothetical protein
VKYNYHTGSWQHLAVFQSSTPETVLKRSIGKTGNHTAYYWTQVSIHHQILNCFGLLTEKGIELRLGYDKNNRTLSVWSLNVLLKPGFELSKNKWGLTSAYSSSLSLHTGDSASLTAAGG